MQRHAKAVNTNKIFELTHPHTHILTHFFSLTLFDQYDGEIILFA